MRECIDLKSTLMSFSQEDLVQNKHEIY
jgi:hypothetical protein